MKTFQEQTRHEGTLVLVVVDFNKFNNRVRPLETRQAFRSGYWNCFVPTVELVKYLQESEIQYLLQEKGGF